jgi:hypothetical protein
LKVFLDFLKLRVIAYIRRDDWLDFVPFTTFKDLNKRLRLC